MNSAKRFPDEVGEFWKDEFGHCEFDGVGGAGDGENEGGAVLGEDDAGGGAGEDGARTDVGIGEHTEYFAKTGESLGQERGDGIKGIVALGNAGSSIEDNHLDIGPGGQVVDQGADQCRIVLGNGLEGDGVPLGKKQRADQFSAVIRFGGARIGAGDNRAGDGLMVGEVLMLLVAHEFIL